VTRLADCTLAADPAAGSVAVALPGGGRLVLTADDLQRLAFLTRGDESDPEGRCTACGALLLVVAGDGGLSLACPGCDRPDRAA
jgi:hypothetical protein